MGAEEFDYIIVGGGTAGLVLANRLSEDVNISVAVIEAGPEASADSRVAIPGEWIMQMGSELDWAFLSVPQKELGDRRITVPQGKHMGGCSGINLQAIVPFSASDVDAWEELGNAGWNWRTLGRKLRNLFAITLPDDPIAEHLHISWAKSVAGAAKTSLLKASFPGVLENPIPKAWVETFKELGYPLTGSPFSGRSLGAYNAAASVDPENVTRSYSNTGYYLPVTGRSNLKIFTQAMVGKVLLEDGSEPTAVGVQFTKDGNATTINAKKEVILCAGVFNSPKLLELSGIGDPDILRAHGIETKVANPYVGTNLQDHTLTSIRFQCTEDVPGNTFVPMDALTRQAGRESYQKDKTGALASSGATSFAYLNVADLIGDSTEEKAIVDIVKNTEGLHPLDSARQELVLRILDGKDEGTVQYMTYVMQASAGVVDPSAPRNAYAPPPETFLSIFAALSHPLSTGAVHISSPDPAVAPSINYKYFSHPADLEIQSHHVRYIENIAAAEPLASLLKPDAGRQSPAAHVNGDLDRAKELIRLESATNHHPCGTCAMAPREKGGVVDTQLRVYGVKGLRIVDASVFPLVPQSNLQTLVYAVAERASDIIRGRV